jgi:hypothetical protein
VNLIQSLQEEVLAMREQFAQHATVLMMSLVFLVSPRAWAQEQTERAARGQVPNPAAAAVQNERAAQNRNEATGGAETIRGLISGITAEGEVVLDYRTNAAARAEGAFLTIVGSPIRSEPRNDDRRASGLEREQHAASGKKRHNIYMAWLTPRTKIFEATQQPAKFEKKQGQNASPTQSASERKEIAFDQLEVGDRVQIQFSPQEESGANRNVHQNQQMRQKHGRNRTFVGYATSIMVLPAMDHAKSNSGVNASSRERAR